MYSAEFSYNRGAVAKNDFSKLVRDVAVPVEAVLHLDQTIEEALVHLRNLKIDDKIVYFYVVDKKHRLKGVVPTRQLLLRDPKMSISEVMNPSVIALEWHQTLEEAMEILASNCLLALPVVDEDRCLMGLVDVEIYFEESVDIANTRRRNDVFQILGFNLEEGKLKSPWKSYRLRMPWILCNMVGGIGCAIISRIFEGVLAKVLLLAMFIPLVLTLSESISMQSMTQSLHWLQNSQRLSWKKILMRGYTEGKVVVLLSLSCGLLAGFLSLFWGNGIWPGISIAISLSISIILSASVGGSIPMLLHSRQMDPKIAAGPVALMFSDVITTAIYLSLASWILL